MNVGDIATGEHYAAVAIDPHKDGGAANTVAENSAAMRADYGSNSAGSKA